MNLEIKQTFTIGDKTFNTKAEANAYVRRPKIKEAFEKFIDDGVLVDWFIDNELKVQDAFESGTIRRVTKSEASKLAKALDAIAENGNKAFAFVIENTDVIKESFRWPSVKRMTDEEKVALSKNTLMSFSDNNEELADWIIENKTAILEAYQAGIEKRPVNPAAKEALAVYQAKKAAEKLAKQAAEAVEAAALGASEAAE